MMLYKIKNDLAPDYLSELLPPQNYEYISYNLRNNQNIAVPFTRLDSYSRSFFPSAIRLWNRLTSDIRNSDSLSTFKQRLKGDEPEYIVLYYYGSRWPSVHQARLRIGCSKLNSDLCFRLHVKSDPSCACGAQVEDAQHFLLTCPLYNDLRTILEAEVLRFCELNLNTLLYGNHALSLNDNKAIFDAVHQFITDSQRFT